MPSRPSSAASCAASRGHLAVALPVVQVRHDLALDEAAHRSRSACARRCVQTLTALVLQESASGMSTCRERSHSPSALACGSNRAGEATPSPRMPSTTKFTARRFGSSCRVTGRPAASGSRRLSSSTVRVCASHAPRLVGARPDADVRVAALVAAAGAGDGAERHPRPSARRPQRLRAARGSATVARVSRTSARRARCRRRVPSGSTAMCGTSPGVDVPGGEHAVGLPVARRRGQREAGVARQRQFDRARTRSRGRPRSASGSLDHARAAARSPSPRCRRPGGRCGPASRSVRPAGSAATPRAAAAPARPSPRCRVR